MKALLCSRKFQAAALAVAINLVLYFAGKYWPQVFDDVQYVINQITVLASFYIGGTALEDYGKKRATLPGAG